MTPTIRAATALLCLACLVAPAALLAETNAELVEQVRQTETAFAKTMADRNAAAFESFLAEEAVFSQGERALTGKAEVMSVWKKFYEGAAAPFSWQPANVYVLASGTLGLSSGPVFDPSGARVGTFNSVWRREADGKWRIIFDRGCPPCECGPKP